MYVNLFRTTDNLSKNYHKDTAHLIYESLEEIIKENTKFNAHNYKSFKPLIFILFLFQFIIFIMFIFSMIRSKLIKFMNYIYLKLIQYLKSIFNLIKIIILIYLRLPNIPIDYNSRISA